MSTKQRGIAKQSSKRRRPVLSDDDRRLQSVMNHLYGSWSVESLARKIRHKFHFSRRHPLIGEVAQQVCDLYCYGSYAPEDMALLVERLFVG